MSPATSAAKPWESQYRIPSHTRALHYDLYLNPNLTSSTFSGRVNISIETTAPTSFFVVHVKYLNVTSTAVTRAADSSAVALDSTPFEYDPNEFWVVPLASEAAPGLYSLQLEFNGRLDNGIVGFYRSVYKDANSGKERVIVSSKFQPTYARRAFPCFDEPSFKSTFDITLVRPSEDGYVALSNMPEASSAQDRPEPGLTEVTFKRSEPMVTYLAIFLVCDFAFLETTTPKYKIPFRVYGTPQQKDKLQYAMDIGSHITDFYQNYFDVAYPLPKLDMAAIPDYSSGATEHWGLITYRETALIYDPVNSATSNRIRVADVIAHELAHQWFGNLMTLDWWNDLWLNEGFASYIQFKGLKSYETTWDTDSMFLTSNLHRVLNLDATLSSHAIVVQVDTPDQITAVFDAISYLKGSSVIRMMESFMGEQDFRKGIHNFLAKYKFKNAITQDLFDELTAVSSSSKGLDVTKIMNTWTRQKGYPVLTLTKTNNSTCYEIEQRRFLSDPDAYGQPDEESPYNYKWEVPLTYISSQNKDVNMANTVWLHLDDPTVSVPIPPGVDWLKFNVGQLGYYRVNYPEEDWAKFGRLLHDNLDDFSISDRTGLINDAFSLAAAERLSYPLALGLTRYLSKEKALAPWEVTLEQVAMLEDVFYYTDVYPQLLAYKRQLVRGLVQELGWSDEGDFTTRQLRTLVYKVACSSGLADCLHTVRRAFADWKDHGKFVAPDLRTIVYTYGVKAAAAAAHETWTWMFERYRQESNAQEKLKLMHGLAASKEPWILHRFLQLAKDPANVREQDFFSVLSCVSNNRVGESLVWDFVRQEWDYLVGRFSLNDRVFGRALYVVTSRFASEQRLAEMRQFFAEHPEAGAGERYRQIALETVQNNIKFVEKHADNIGRCLAEMTEVEAEAAKMAEN